MKIVQPLSLIQQFCAVAAFGFVMFIHPGVPVVHAAEQKPIFVVDITRVVRESIMGKAAIHEMEEERKKRQLVLEKGKLDVQQLQDSIKKQGSLLSQSALQEKKELLDRKQREFARSVQDAEADLVKKNQMKVQKVLEQVDQVVKELAVEQECEIVMDADPRIVIYVDERLSLTEAVIERMDELKA